MVRALLSLLVLGVASCITAFIIPTSISSIKTKTFFSAATHTAIPVVTETLILPMGDDSQLKIRLSQDTFKDLALKTNALLASFRAIKAANQAETKGPPPREPSMMFVVDDFKTHFEMECNPNIFPDAFHASVFVKVNNDVMEVSSQCQLSALVDALKLYKVTYKIPLEQPPASDK